RWRRPGNGRIPFLQGLPAAVHLPYARSASCVVEAAGEDEPASPQGGIKMEESEVQRVIDRAGAGDRSAVGELFERNCEESLARRRKSGSQPLKSPKETFGLFGAVCALPGPLHGTRDDRIKPGSPRGKRPKPAASLPTPKEHEEKWRRSFRHTTNR